MALSDQDLVNIHTIIRNNITNAEQSIEAAILTANDIVTGLLADIDTDLTVQSDRLAADINWAIASVQAVDNLIQQSVLPAINQTAQLVESLNEQLPKYIDELKTSISNSEGRIVDEVQAGTNTLNAAISISTAIVTNQITSTQNEIDTRIDDATNLINENITQSTNTIIQAFAGVEAGIIANNNEQTATLTGVVNDGVENLTKSFEDMQNELLEVIRDQGKLFLETLTSINKLLEDLSTFDPKSMPAMLNEALKAYKTIPQITG